MAPDSSQFLVGARELARTVEAAVQSDPVRWLARPFQTGTTLKEPSHISHFLRGAAKTVADVPDLSVDDLLDVVRLVRSHPWEPTPLGRDDFDYDPDWSRAEVEAVTLLRALADKDIGYVGRDNEAFDAIRAAVLNLTEGSGVLGDPDPLTVAVNRPCTQALEAAVSFMAYEHRTHGSAPPGAFELLEAVLRLESADGAQHRAILASRFGYFISTAPDWVDANAQLIFGPDAPDELGQLSVDLTLRWSRPLRWLLEHFGPAVRDAVVRDVDNALDQMLIANIWGIPGYSTDELINFFTSHAGLLSRAGEALGRLVRNTEDPDHIAAAVHLWGAAIEADTREDRSGFGWFTEVTALDDERWAQLTLATLRTSNGRIDWAHGVAERVHPMAPSTTTLAIFDDLVRHSERDWDRRRAAELAAEHIGRAEHLAGSAEHQRLRTTLLERGLL